MNSLCLSMILAAASPMMTRLIITACWVRLSAHPIDKAARVARGRQHLIEIIAKPAQAHIA
jgi:hypothetical protein